MISSHANPLIKQIKKLRQKKHRQEEGLFFAEGLRVVLTALEQPEIKVACVVYAPDLLTSEVATQKIQEATGRGIRCEAVTAEVFAGLSERDNPAGLGAIIHSHTRPLEGLPITPQAVFVALWEASDPGNVGTILRTMDAVQASGLILVGASTEVSHPAALKASMGTAFTMPTATCTPEQLAKWVEQNGLQLVATSAHAQANYWQASYPRPLVLLMGSEQHGLPADWLGRAQQTVVIPMQGQATSLNLAIATSLLLYEIRRQQS
jgi:TrmH family RNA methyltransferase